MIDATNGNNTSEILDQAPPHSLEAECGVLGSILFRPQVLPDVLQLVSPGDFFHDANGAILSTMMQLDRDGVGIDLKSLHIALLTRGKLELVGGNSYLADLIGASPTATNATYYARIVREASIKRRIRQTAVRMLVEAANGTPAADLVASIRADLDAIERGGENSNRLAIRRLTSSEFDQGDYTQSYLVDDVLAERQPLVLAAPLKTMKTTIAVALAIALALARQFLGKFWVREAVNVLVLSGESGLSTLQGIGRRIAESYGCRLSDVGRLFWSTDLPRLGNAEHLAGLREAIERDEIAVLICDPLYFMLPDADAANLMIVGGYLRELSALCDELGVTLVVVHHLKKSGIDNKHAPPELSQISWSGTAEWARQWILLGRREAYVPGSGEHVLWMVTGGSAGHSGQHVLHIHEGVGDARGWHVEVLNTDDVRSGEEDAKENAKEAKRQAQLERDKKTILAAVAKLPDRQGTKSEIKEDAGLNSKAFGPAFAELTNSGELVPCDITKRNKQLYPGFRLPHDPA